MAAYRLYERDGAGRFSAAEWIEADDDASATEAARALGKTCRCELWRRDTFVATIDPIKA
jgi:DNA-binding transcriptional regulator/RsmH inhibitor MraZ